MTVAVGGCGGGSSGGGSGGGGGGGNSPPANVTVSGVVTFDRVPSVAGLGLDYARTEARPARGVTVELMSGDAVLGRRVADETGAYSFDVASNSNVSLRARAEVVRDGTPAWNFSVLDNTQSDALFVLEGTAFNTGSADSTHNLHAPSGWNGSSYAAPRSAAPFAILDVVYDCVQLVLSADPDTVFPPLELHWSENNVPSLDANGAVNTATGEIGSSRYSPLFGLFIVGAADADSDEYDRHVVAHEWAHYLVYAFARSDSIGGPHGFGDQLDLRVAFGEGWASAFSAMATGDPVYVDAHGPGQALGFALDIEGPWAPGASNPTPGWFNQMSIQELLYDLYDDEADIPADTLALGFAPLFDVLVDRFTTTPALTSIFPFIAGLSAALPGDEAAIDALLASQSIAPIVDDYGSNETNFGHPESPDYQSIYSSLIVNDLAPVVVCSIDDFASPPRPFGSGSFNKLGSRRLLRFDVAATGPQTITVRAVPPLNDYADPDFLIYRAGPTAISNGPPSTSCKANGVATPSECVEQASINLPAGEYILEVFEWTNTNTAGEEFPPIGRTCFATTVTAP